MKLFLTSLLLLSGIAVRLNAADDDRLRQLERRYDELEQRYKILERKWELNQEAAAEKSKSAASVSIGASGFSMRSGDTNFVFKLWGLLQVDSRTFLDDSGIKNNDTFLIRRARPIIEGTIYHDFDFLFVPEFGGTGSPSILDAYLNYRYKPELQLRVGKFKVPVGLEQLQSDSTAFFIERGHPSKITPNRDVGVQVHGDLWDSLLLYAVGVFNGVGDGATSNNADVDDEKSIAARLFAHPFRKSDIKSLQGLGVGVGGSYGNSEGAALPTGGGYVSEGQQRFFAYEGTVIADGDIWRVSPQAYWYFGPFGLLGEYVISSQRLRLGTTPTFGTIDNTAWQIAGSWVITGEDASYRGITPKRDFNPANGTWGAFEFVARYGVLDIDDDAFPAFASDAASGTRADSWGIGLNWYLNRQIRAAVNFMQTDFNGGENGTNPVLHHTENVFLTRLQLAF